MSRSSHRFGVRGQSRRIRVMANACLMESLEIRQLLAHSPLTEVLPNTPGANGGLTSAAQGAGGNQSQSLGWSRASGVRYLDGAVKFMDTDFSTNGYNMPWGSDRSWSNVVGFATTDNSHNGNGWFDTQLPYVVAETVGSDALGKISVVVNGLTTQVFSRTSSSLVTYDQKENFNENSLQYVGGKLILTDSVGNQIAFEDFTTGYNPRKKGGFASFTDAYGNVTTATRATSGTDNGLITSISRTTGSVTETFAYVYNADGTIASVDMQRNTGGSHTVRKVEYAYYSTDDPFGMSGDLKSATVKDGSGNVLDRNYYRYYSERTVSSISRTRNVVTLTLTGHKFEVNDWITISGSTNGFNGTFQVASVAGDGNSLTFNQTAANATGTGTTKVISRDGYARGLRYAFSDRSMGRLIADHSDYATQANSVIAPYANDAYTYDPSTGKVLTVAVQGAGDSSTYGGIGTYQYSYPASTTDTGYNQWAEKTVETQPDGSTNTYYTNSRGQVVLRYFSPSGSSSKWITFFDYDTNGVLNQKAIASAMYSATTTNGTDYLALSDSSIGGGTTLYFYERVGRGLVYDFISTSEVSGGGFSPSSFGRGLTLRQGRTGSPKQVTVYNYDSFTIDPDGTGGQDSTTLYKMSASGEFTNAPSAPTGDAPDRTVISDWDNTTWTRFGPTSVTRYAPETPGGQNGPGDDDPSTLSDRDTTVTFFDSFGRSRWVKDGGDKITYTAYDDSTGTPTKKIADVNTGSGFSGDYSSLPSGWANTSGLELITLFRVDELGRVSKMTEPRDVAGTIATYNVYDDVQHSVKTYPAWDTSTHVINVPTIMSREDRAGGYSESLTMSATANYDATTNEPTGGESVGTLQTLSRTYRSIGGQAVRSDRYFFNLSGITYSTSAYIGTQDTNYYKTTYDYDSRGRRFKTTLPTLTVNETDYDSLGRITARKVGTTTTSMTTTTEYKYDGDGYSGVSGIGDAALTQIIQHPGGGAADRITLMYYDWRNRRMAVKRGATLNGGTDPSDGTRRLVEFTDYDNLGEAIATYSFAGDGVAPDTSVLGNGFTVKLASGDTLDGIAQKLSDSLLRANTINNFDNQGRIYSTNVKTVDPSTGSVGSGIDTGYYFDHRGNLIEVANPGGLKTKSVYDGAGRVTKVYQTDGATGTSWSNASSVTSDHVITQTQIDYDANDNPIFWRRRDRFHDDNIGTGDTGELGGPSDTIGGGTAPARVYYSEAYYDGDNRMTGYADLGTNGGTSLSARPDSSVPTRSLTKLVTTYTYDTSLGGWNDSITDPRSLLTKYARDNAGRVTKTIENYVNGTMETTDSKEDDDRTTEWTYDGSDHVVTMRADLPSSAYQETKWVYGVTTAGGSNVNSNDLLGAIQFPNKTSGAASSSEQETYKVNALGQRTSFTDRRTDVHDYTYDLLGRMTRDTASTVVTGVDGSVRQLRVTFDDAGRPTLFTSYDTTSSSPSDSNIVNQVERLYNGLGQVTDEYQEHTGKVAHSTTPETKYTYALHYGTSDVIGMVYPDGRTLYYSYDSVDRLIDIGDTIDDHGSISTDSLEQYSYLGLDTIVKQHRPGAGDLTYLYSELFPKAVDGHDRLSGDSFSVDEHDAVDQVL